MNMTSQVTGIKPEVLWLRDTTIFRIIGKDIGLVVRRAISCRILDPVQSRLIQHPRENCVRVEQHHIRIRIRVLKCSGVVRNGGIVPPHHGRVGIWRGRSNVAGSSIKGR